MNRKKILALLLSLAVFMSFSVVTAFADDSSAATAKKAPVATAEAKAPVSGFDAGSMLQNDVSKAAFLKDRLSKKSFVYDDDNGDYITWNRNLNFVLYKGQKLNMDYKMYDTWENYSTIPFFTVYDEDVDNLIYSWAPSDPYWIVTADSWDRYTGNYGIKSNSLPAGKYVILISAMPCGTDGIWVDDLSTFDIPTEVVTFTVKKLPKPTNVKLTTGKKRVTVTFKKSTGATKYQIFRSTKKSSGYTRIATITGNKYIDKKAKKGKRYYYKVRALRGTETTGKAFSFYTTPKRSTKVK